MNKIGETVKNVLLSIAVFFIATLTYNLITGAADFLNDRHYAKTQDADCIPDVYDSEKLEICLTYKRIEVEQYFKNYTQPDDCKNAVKKNLCMFLLARKSLDPSTCQIELEGFSEQDMCVHNLAVYKRDKTVCNFIDNIACRSICEDHIDFSLEGDKKRYNTVILSNACPLETAETFCAFRNCDTELLQEIIEANSQYK